MNPRIDVTKYLTSGLLRALFNLSTEVEGRIERPLLQLVEIRASQINGCAYCIDMHTKDARLAGETEQRIYALNAWRETPFFTDRERAALEWTEAVTRVADTHVPDEIYDRVAAQFNEADLVALTFAVIVINSWNRLSISLRPTVGTYQPKAVAV
jgi:AhpD family alkylhydroperoxidase